MIERLRVARLRRAYRTIARVERRLKDKGTAARLRTGFASDTVNLIDAMYKQGHIPRRARRQAKRDLIS